MSLRGVLAELRHRGVLKVAAAYAAIGWVALQGLSLLFQSFDAPGWVIKVVTTLAILGLPVACLMAWGFEFKDGGVHPAPPMNPDAPAKPGRADAFLAGLLLLVLGLLAVLVVQQWRRPAAVVPATAAATQTKPVAAARTATSTRRTVTDDRGSARAAYRRDNGYAGPAWRLRAQHAGQERH